MASKSDLGSLRSEVERLGRKIEVVDHRVELSEHRLRAEVDRRLRVQTWITRTTLLAGLGLAFTAGRIG